MIDLIKNNRLAIAIVLFSGAVFTVMTQLNWLYLVREDNFHRKFLQIKQYYKPKLLFIR